MRVTVKKSSLYCPSDGEHDLLILDVDPRDEKFGITALVTFAILDKEDHGKSFGIFYSANAVTPRTKLGALLQALGHPVEEWAEAEQEVDIEQLLAGVRLRAVTVSEERDTERGPVRRVAQLKPIKVYGPKQGPKLDAPPF